MSAVLKTPLRPEPLTFEDYLVWEEDQEERHEFINGRVLAMAGASDAHELAALNLAALLVSHLRGKGCRAYKGDMKLRYRAGQVDLSYYPDVMVVCDPTDDHASYKEKPAFLAEVMFRFKTDHFEKLFIYQQIGTLEEYLVLSQNPEEPAAWLYRRAEGWKMPAPVTAGEITLASLGLNLTLEELYRS
jgi:Uma2 family endonuclease